MNINFNDIITNNEDEKKLINYISKSDNKKIEESMLIIEKYTGYKLNDFINDLENIDIGLMLFIGLLEALSGQNIFKIYSKAFQAIILLNLFFFGITAIKESFPILLPE